MGIHLCGVSVMPLALCVLLGAPAAGQEKKQKPQNSIESLFEGLPADLRKNVKSNPVRIDRVNDWLKEHVNGKGKTIEVRVPVDITPRRAQDGTYNVVVAVDRHGPTVKMLGEAWPLVFVRKPVAKSKDGKKGGLSKGGFAKVPKLFRNLAFVGVSTEDAEKLADLKEVTIQGKVQEAEISDRLTTNPAIILVLDDVRLNGKKLMSYKPAAEK